LFEKQHLCQNEIKKSKHQISALILKVLNKVLHMHKEHQICHISKLDYHEDQVIPFSAVKKELIFLIQKDFPDFTEGMYISSHELSNYRKKYLESILQTENRELNRLEKEVVKAIHENRILSENIEPDSEEILTTGQKIADKIAVFGGSWTFILAFFSFIVLWMIVNMVLLAARPFDPYPFILLNLILSCLAAIQAPIIMMSQNRLEQKDRKRNEHDYKVNLKAELEIRLLNEKMDHLIIHQNKRMLEIQQIQLDYLDELSKKNESK